MSHTRRRLLIIILKSPISRAYYMFTFGDSVWRIRRNEMEYKRRTLETWMWFKCPNTYVYVCIAEVDVYASILVKVKMQYCLKTNKTKISIYIKKRKRTEKNGCHLPYLCCTNAVVVRGIKPTLTQQKDKAETTIKMIQKYWQSTRHTHIRTNERLKMELTLVRAHIRTVRDRDLSELLNKQCYFRQQSIHKHQ